MARTKLKSTQQAHLYQTRLSMAISKTTQEKEILRQRAHVSLDNCVLNLLVLCCSGDNFVVHCDVRIVHISSIRISIELPVQMHGVSIRADVFAGESCLKQH